MLDRYLKSQNFTSDEFMRFASCSMASKDDICAAMLLNLYQNYDILNKQRLKALNFH